MLLRLVGWGGIQCLHLTTHVFVKIAYARHRFDLASILTRAPSMWHPRAPSQAGDEHGASTSHEAPDGMRSESTAMNTSVAC